jgi:hypothetical protein
MTRIAFFSFEPGTADKRGVFKSKRDYVNKTRINTIRKIIISYDFSTD